MVKTETRKRILKITVGKKESISRIFQKWVFPHRERLDITDMALFELRTVHPIEKITHNDIRLIEEFGNSNKKALGLYIIDKF